MKQSVLLFQSISYGQLHPNKMGVLFGLYILGIIFTAVLLLLLASTTYYPLKNYIGKWNEMRPIPGMAGAYPFIGNALQFKTNAGGKGL